MQVKVLKECGYDESALGFSLSHNSSIERAKFLLPKYAFGIPGENKFLESMIVYLDVIAPRFWWQEADCYRVGSTKQSESTMHTIMKGLLTQENFEYLIWPNYLDFLNQLITQYNKNKSLDIFLVLKNHLPEGFLQRRIWVINYKTLQNIYSQRKNHKLNQWHIFLDTVLGEIEHPEFIVNDNIPT